jgi:DNA-binding response OmpR family regulator
MNCGYRVDTASDGQAGWEQIQATEYDLLITDLDMPRMTGLELIEQIHLNKLHLPTLLVTAGHPPDLFHQSSGRQIEATLLKPYTLDELLAVVSSLLHGLAVENPEFAAPSRRPPPPISNRSL